MDIYIALKVLHVIAAAIWVGGGITMLVLSMVASQEADRRLAMLRDFSRLGPIFLPLAVVVVLTGGTLVFTGHWGAAPRVLATLVTVGSSFVLGGAFLGPIMERVEKLAATGDVAGALAVGRPLVPIGRIEQALHIATICLMVAKPGWAGVAVAAALCIATVILRDRRAGSPIPA